MTEEERLKRNAYMREWTRKNREKCNARAREYRANLSPEERVRVREYKRAWANSRSEEQKEAARKRLREHMRAKRATPEGAASVEAAIHKYRSTKRAELNARDRERRKNMTPEQRKKKNEYDRTHRMRWTAERREADRIAHLNWRKENRESRSASEHKRRAAKKGNGGSHTGAEWKALKTRFGFQCLCCQRKEPEIKLTVDHVIPLSRGGTNDIGNIQPLCFSCNASKQDRIVDYRPVESVEAA